MSCRDNEDSCCRGSHFFMWVVLLAAGAVVIASLPEIKRYIKISSM
jgi:hypothetical protein